MMTAVLLFAASLASAADVVLVAEDNKILQTIAEAFRAEFKGSAEVIPFDGGALAKAKAAGPKVVVALGPAAAKAAKDSGLPMLYGGVLNPRQHGLDTAAGVPMTVPVKRQWAAAVKGFKTQRIGVLLSDGNAEAKADVAEAAQELGVKAKVSPVSGDDLASALRALETEVDALWIPLDPAVAQQTQFKAIVDFSLKKKIPLVVPTASFVKQGGLLSVSMAYPEMGRLLAAQAKAVVGGASPKAASKQTSANEEIAVNLAVAKEIGANASPDFLNSATKIN